MRLHIYKDADAVCEALAEWIVELMNKTLQQKERFTWALSGGETPKKLYQLLASKKFSKKINWSKIFIFWGDERVVPFDDERSNAKMAYDNLLYNVAIPSSQINKILTDVTPEESAKQYEKLLHKYFDDNQLTFDLALLGMGDDGHTLSLFPDSENLNDKTSWVKTDNIEHTGMKRITLMPAVINRSCAIVFLVTGKNKAKVLKEILQEQLLNYPAALIKPLTGELHWFVDEAAGITIK